jgi:hypothetical protein
MKNKNLMLLLGVGVAYYFLYKMYAKKSTDNVIKNPVMPPVLNNTSTYTEVIDVTSVPSQFLSTRVPDADLYTPNTYQTYYGSIAGNNYKVPSTC